MGYSDDKGETINFDDISIYVCDCDGFAEMTGVSKALALVCEKINNLAYASIKANSCFSSQSSALSRGITFYFLGDLYPKIGAIVVGKSIESLSSYYGPLNSMTNFIPIEIGSANEDGVMVSAIGFSLWEKKDQ